MKPKYLIPRILAGILIVWSVGLYAEREQHSFTLYKATRDPFTQQYEITIEEPCELKVYVQVDSADRSLSRPLFVSFAHKSSGKPKIIGTSFYSSKKKNFKLVYGIDSIELQKGKQFVINLNNVSRHKNATGTILIAYSGKTKEEGAKPVYADLSVSNIYLNRDGTLAVEVTNNGPGKLSQRYWSKNQPDIIVYRNGKSWGGVMLQALDPQKKLNSVGGKVTYTFNTLVVTGKESIRVVIDSHNTVREENEKNNEMTKELGTANSNELKMHKMKSP